MALFKTEAHNLVMVGDTFVTNAAPAALASLAKGVFGLYGPGNDPLDPATDTAAAIKIALGTGKSSAPVGGTAPLQLVSETLTAKNVKSIVSRAYAAPVQQVTEVTVTSATAGEHVIAIEFSEWGSNSAQNYHSIYATYVAAAGATVTNIADGLVANFNKNAARAGKPVVASNVAGVITFTAQAQPVVGFRNPFKVTRFNYVTKVTPGTVFTQTANTPANAGSGYGPTVANLEHMAQGAAANWFWDGQNFPYQNQYERDLLADPAKTYDICNIVVETVTNDVAQLREITLCIDQVAGGAALVTAIKTVLGIS